MYMKNLILWAYSYESPSSNMVLEFGLRKGSMSKTIKNMFI